MPNEFKRPQRVGDLLKRQLAENLRALRDPRLGLISITEIEMSRDLGHARVFFTMVDCESEAEIDSATAVLNGASGFLKKGLSESTGLRMIPKIRFFFDRSISRARDLHALIHEANYSPVGEE